MRDALCRMLTSLARAIATSGSAATATAPSVPPNYSRPLVFGKRPATRHRQYPMATWADVMILNGETGEVFHAPLNPDLT